MANIIKTNTGLADRIGDEILINKRLFENDELLAWVLAHELEHSGHLTTKDIKHDFKPSDFKMAFKLFLWQCKTPETWTQFMPYRKYKNQRYWDMSNIILWSFGLIILLFLNWHYYG